MDKNLSQEEINALFNQINDSSSVDIPKETNIDEKLESLLDYKYNENAKMIQDLFKENNKTDNNEQTNSEDIAYQNSPYYPMYLNIVGNMKSMLAPMIMQIEAEYRFMESRNYLSDLVLKKMGKEILLPNFILAKVKYDEFMNFIVDAINELKTIDDIDYNIDIRRAEYIKNPSNENVLKKIDGYKIVINIKRHQKLK
ncbi:MAG: hypothetical protein J6G98_04430 [Bacilli bacterium]|nr:hypothetical protein [Bacilli bacterium]